MDDRGADAAARTVCNIYRDRCREILSISQKIIEKITHDGNDGCLNVGLREKEQSPKVVSHCMQQYARAQSRVARHFDL